MGSISVLTNIFNERPAARVEGNVAYLLVIDDDMLICQSLAGLLEPLGHSLKCCQTLYEGLNEAHAFPFDVVFLDIKMPDGNGLNFLPEFRQAPGAPEVIIMTGFGDPDGAELAIKNGAWDYILKPPSVNSIILPLQRALQFRDEKQKAQEHQLILRCDGIIGRSSAMQACFELLGKAALSDANVLISGETGTGKELFARAVHQNSSRASHNFVVVDCAAIPANLVESILFGYKKGAFTGADKDFDGLILRADGGTLFLDEVGELPLPLQKAFLRVLQDRHFRPLGGKKEIASNFRLVAATNRDLEHRMRTGDFREDLLFRLRTLTIHLPPLRERKGDLGELARNFLARSCERYGLEPKGITPEFLEALNNYEWPGNVRELGHTLEEAVISARQEPTLFTTHLPEHIRIHLARRKLSDSQGRPGPSPMPDSEATFKSYRDARLENLKKFEFQYLQQLITHTGGNVKEACQLSQLSKTRLYDLLKKYRLLR